MNADGNTHEHVLRTLHHFPTHFEQVRPFQGLEPEVRVVVVAIVDDGGVQPLEMATY